MARKGKKPSYEEMEEANEYLSAKTAKGPLEYNVDLKCKTATQKEMVKLFKSSQILIVNGPAGTGKTYLACAEALRALKNNAQVQKIVVIKSVTILEGEDIGFLKGTMMEKMEPFMYSFMSNFTKLIGQEATKKLLDSGMIQVLPLAYIRGMSIDNAIIIIDEAQNISKPNMRTIMTRLGENSKMVLLGDQKQIDLKNKKVSSLDLIIEKFTGKEGFGTVTFGREDIVRNPLVKIIEETFDQIEGFS